MAPRRTFTEVTHMNILDIVGRNSALFDTDMRGDPTTLAAEVSARFLVIGGANDSARPSGNNDTLLGEI